MAVVVEATDELLDDIIRNLNPDYIQLHGKETEKRAKEIREKFDIKLIRSVIASEQRERGNPDWIASSSQATSRNDELYSFLLFDSEGGGTGKQFDYSGFKAPSQPWFLSGGLNAGNVAAAAKATGAKLLDVSSGVEREKGVKDPQKIIEFLKVVNGI